MSFFIQSCKQITSRAFPVSRVAAPLVTSKRTWFGFGMETKKRTQAPQPWYTIEPEDDTDSVLPCGREERKERLAIQKELLKNVDETGTDLRNAEEMTTKMVDLFVKWKDTTGAVTLYENEELVVFNEASKAKLVEYLEAESLI
eukprot:m.26112 g.26112  ORF g.26112 m.26112 type:complete len:144 (+) comp9240_c1_seq1:150-581(+)